MDWNLVAQLLGSTVRLSVPILLACLAGLYAERSGVLDIGLEGKMMIAAFAAAAAANLTGSAWVGLGSAICASVALGLLHGFASITLRGNQLISGVSINMLALGIAGLVGSLFFGMGGKTPALAFEERFHGIQLPLHESAGMFYREIISGHNFIVYFALISVVATWWVFYRTRYGLQLRAVGQSPGAVDAAGISVAGLRYSALVVGGVLCGFAGAYLSIAQSAGYTEAMTADRGFVALAALIFAKWRPFNALFTCLLFGFVEAIGFQFQGSLDFDNRSLVTIVEFLEASFPYILTVIILAGFVGKAIPPAAGGIPYVKDG